MSFWPAILGPAQAVARGFVGRAGAGSGLPLAFLGAVADVVEGNSGSANVVVPVTLSAPAGAGGVQISWAVVGAGAAPADPADFQGGVYPAGTLVIPAGQLSGNITFAIAGDVAIEPDEGVAVSIFAPVGAQIGLGTRQFLIVNDDAPVANLAAVPDVTEGNTGTATVAISVSLTGPAPAGGASVAWAVTGFGASPAGAADFGGSFPGGTILIPAGETTGGASFTVSGDTTAEPDEGFQVTLSSPVNCVLGTATRAAVILNDDGSGSLAPLAAISGERLQGGIDLGADNGLSATAGRGITLPSEGCGIRPDGDWCFIIEGRVGGNGYSGGGQARQVLLGIGPSATTNYAASAGALYLDSTTMRLFLQRLSANTQGGQGNLLPAGANGAPVDLGITCQQGQSFICFGHQRGNVMTVRYYDLATGAVQVFTSADNKSVAPNLYSGVNGARPASEFTNLFTAIGRAASGTNLHGWGGQIGLFAMAWTTLTDAQMDAIAAGATGIGTLPGLRYINRLRPNAALTQCAAEPTDRAGSALPITGAASIVRTGFTNGPWEYGPFRFGGQVRGQQEHADYVFPLMPGRSTGRVWFDGSSSAAGYPIYGRLVRVSDGSELLGWTQLAANHPGGAFRHPVNGIAAGVPFYREFWVGPATSVIGGPDGHLFAERNRMAIGIKGMPLGQSQDNYDAHPGATGTGTGGTLAPAPAQWMQISIGQRATSGNYARNDGPAGFYGPRPLRSFTGSTAIGDGVMQLLNNLAADLQMPVHLLWASRSGHAAACFAYDRIPASVNATGSGNSRSASLGVALPAGVGATQVPGGVEPGSIVVTTANLGQFTDSANSAFTGTQLLAANTQPFPASGALSSGTINYQTGALALNFSSDPGAVSVAFTTRYDTTEGNMNIEATPDRFTLFGSSPENGVVRRLMAQAPRHGLSFVMWDGHTSSLSDFGSNSEAQFQTAKNGRRQVLEQLLIGRIWPLCDGTNPPLILGQHMRGTTASIATGAHMRRCDEEIALVDRPYNPAAATDASSGATALNYAWFGGAKTAISMENNNGEHQDAQITGGRRRGAARALAVRSLMQANQALAIGPRAISATRRAGQPNIIDVAMQLRPGATALAVDAARTGTEGQGDIPAGNPNALPDWYVYINGNFLAFTLGSGEPCTARINAAGTGVEIQRTTGDWPDPATNTIAIYAYTSGPFFGGPGNPLGGPSNRLAAETEMASALFDNGGGMGGTAPGAMALPIYALQVTP